jgi:hypothetical protein
MNRPEPGAAGPHQCTEKGLCEAFDPATRGNVKWSARLGSETFGSPVVAGGKVFIGTNNLVPRNPALKGNRGALMCFDAVLCSLLPAFIRCSCLSARGGLPQQRKVESRK